MAEWTLFAAGSPGAPNESDGPIALSTGFEIILAGNYWITHLEWFAPADAPSGVEVAVWERVDDATPGANLTGNLSWAGPFTLGARNRFALPTPILVTTALYPNGLYATIRSADRYTATGGYFAVAETNGPLRGWIRGGGKENGRFRVGASDAEYPDDDFNGGGYWITPVITDVDPSMADVEVQDTPGPGAVGGSPDTATADHVVTDTPGTGQAGDSGESVAADAVVVDQPGGVAAGRSAEGVLEGGDVEIADRPGGLSAGGSGETATASETLADNAVWPLLVQFLVCLQDQMEQVESPPRYVQIRPGLAFSAGLSQIEDECCEGSAWIRVASIAPTNNFPAPETGAQSCAPAALAVEIELGALRCRPVASNLDPRNVVTGTQWSDVTRLVMNDAAALRRTACCIAATVGKGSAIIGSWTPQAVEANCVGGTMTVTFQAPACEFTC